MSFATGTMFRVPLYRAALTNVGEGRVFFSYVGLIPVELPLPAPASFCSEDRLLETERALCIHTMKNCMHEHYEDTLGVSRRCMHMMRASDAVRILYLGQL